MRQGESLAQLAGENTCGLKSAARDEYAVLSH